MTHRFKCFFYLTKYKKYDKYQNYTNLPKDSPYSSPSSIQIQLRHNHDPNRLIQATEHTQPQLIPIPIETADTLLANVLLVEFFGSTHDASLVAISVLDSTLGGVNVLVKVESSVASQGDK